MMQVNINQFMAALREVPIYNQPKMYKGTSYLFNHVYNHMLHGEEVKLSELDFSAFEEDDIHSLGELYNSVFERNSLEASRIANTLRKIDPHKQDCCIYIKSKLNKNRGCESWMNLRDLMLFSTG